MIIVQVSDILSDLARGKSNSWQKTLTQWRPAGSLHSLLSLGAQGVAIPDGIACEFRGARSVLSKSS